MSRESQRKRIRQPVRSGLGARRIALALFIGLPVLASVVSVAQPFAARAGQHSDARAPGIRLLSADSSAPYLEAWIYPSAAGQPACDTSSELAAMAADPIGVLKPEYFYVSGSGRVIEETAADGLPCNGYSSANLAEVRPAAQRIYVTVSASSPGVAKLLDNPKHMAAGEQVIESFVAANDLNGVDLDFEPNRWTQTVWTNYMSFVSAIAAAFQPSGLSVEVDLDAFTTTPWDAERYADVASAGAHLVVMAYDDQYNVACSPITPYSWLEAVTSYAMSQVPLNDLTIGIPAYGYYTSNCKKVADMTDNVAYVTMEEEPGFPTTPSAVEALRDPNSGEIRWTSGNTLYDYVDSTALNDKAQVVEGMGVTDISVWSLGGQPWFNGNPG
ncbi:MAG TPA: glycosyl hydrolase family 18 protein [Acidimicrobiales bacterium]|nr:glycosyl hydrolase family 18 protein [Acidimicrobiales bacterium]